MVGSTGQCLEGWDPSELLAYVEGDLPPDRRKELEQHLALCKACSSEVESLRQLDGMLRASPQCFHPDEEDLFRFASRGEDVEGRVSEHLETCEECKEAVAILRGMVAVGPQISKNPQPLPRPLFRALEARHSARPPAPAEPTGRFALLLEWLRRPFGMSMLAVGTVAAALVVVALLIPIWTGLRDVPKPEAVPTLEEAPIPSPGKNGRLEGLQAPLSDYGTGPQELKGSVEKPFPAVKPAPGPSALPFPPPTAPGTALEKAEPLKLKERFGAAPMSPSPTAPLRSKKLLRGFAGPDSERRVGPQEQESPMLKGAPVQRARPVQRERDAQAKPKVIVRIVPPEGQELEGVRFVPPKEMESRYYFADQKTDKEEETLREKDQSPRSTAIPPGEEAYYVVTVRVSQRGVVYGLEGSIAEPGSTIDRKKLSKDNISREHLQIEITALVAALLSGR